MLATGYRAFASLAAAVLLLGAAAGCSPPKPRRPKIAWGAPSKGLQAGLSRLKRAFETGESIKLTVHVKNVGDKPLRVFDAGWPMTWRVVFVPAASVREEPRRARYLPKVLRNQHDLHLAKGEEKTVLLSLGGPGWQFERDARPRAPRRRYGLADPRKALRPAKYTVTAYYLPGYRGGNEYWPGGSVGTGAVEIRIRPKGATR